jgi:hypothetical protein
MDSSAPGAGAGAAVVAAAAGAARRVAPRAGRPAARAAVAALLLLLLPLLAPVPACADAASGSGGGRPPAQPQPARRRLQQQQQRGSAPSGGGGDGAPAAAARPARPGMPRGPGGGGLEVVVRLAFAPLSARPPPLPPPPRALALRVLRRAGGGDPHALELRGLPYRHNATARMQLPYGWRYTLELRDEGAARGLVVMVVAGACEGTHRQRRRPMLHAGGRRVCDRSPRHPPPGRHAGAPSLLLFSTQPGAIDASGAGLRRVALTAAVRLQPVVLRAAFAQLAWGPPGSGGSSDGGGGGTGNGKAVGEAAAGGEVGPRRWPPRAGDRCRAPAAHGPASCPCAWPPLTPLSNPCPSARSRCGRAPAPRRRPCPGPPPTQMRAARRCSSCHPRPPARFGPTLRCRMPRWRRARSQRSRGRGRGAAARSAPRPPFWRRRWWQTGGLVGRAAPGVPTLCTVFAPTDTAAAPPSPPDARLRRRWPNTLPPPRKLLCSREAVEVALPHGAGAGSFPPPSSAAGTFVPRGAARAGAGGQEGPRIWQ